MRIGIPTATQKGNRHQLSAPVRIEADGVNVPPELWFAVHGGEPSFKAEYADPFLPALITVAMKLGEDIQVEAPVSTRLAFGLETYQHVLHTWWPASFKKVDIHYEALELRNGEPRPSGVACCFSGGLDSFHAVKELSPENQSIEDYRITHAMMINGFDQLVDLEHEGLARQMFNIYAPVLDSWGVQLQMIDTNTAQFRHPVTSVKEAIWSFSSALIACAHALGGLFGRFGIPSHATYAEEDLEPGGTHVALDHHLSSDQLEVFACSAKVGRAGKLEMLADDPLVRNNLRVCFTAPSFDAETGGVTNCGKCEKCLRTIVTLLILGKLEQFPGFSERRELSSYQHPRSLANIHGIYLREMEALARKYYKFDWARRLEKAQQLREASKQEEVKVTLDF